MSLASPEAELSVVVLGARNVYTNIVANWLRRHVARVAVVVEDPLPRRAVLRKYMRHYGPVTALGQFLFAAAVAPPLRLASRARIREILDTYGLDPSPPPVETFRVPSVNSEAARQVIASVAPSVAVVQGTRVVGRKTLDAIGVPVVHAHMGIAPLYSGVHGGYWAVADKRRDLVGTTILLVDTGMDTGAVLAHVTFEPHPRDSIVTYPLLHLATALPVLTEKVLEVARGRTDARRNPLGLASRLRPHPTMWGYLFRWARSGVR